MATYPLKTSISDTYPNPSNATARAGFGALWDYTTSIPHGQCRLVKSGANLVLQRYNGQWLRINDAAYSIPSAGVSLAATGLTPSTLYYIYAYMSGATMTLEASTTGHGTDSTTGVEIKTGDATRTLVGMARPITGPAWQDDINQRFVLSWFNRKQIYCRAGLGSSVGSITSVPAIELSTGLRCEMLVWADSVLDFSFDGYSTNSSAFAINYGYLTVDGTLQDAFSAAGNAAASQAVPVAVRMSTNASEGYHYVTPYVSVSAGTGSWVGSVSAGVRCSNKGTIQG